MVTATKRSTGSSMPGRVSRISGCAMKFVILSSIDRGSRMKVGSVTLLRSAPGRSWLMMCDRTVSSHLAVCLVRGGLGSAYHCPGPGRRQSHRRRWCPGGHPRRTICCLRCSFSVRESFCEDEKLVRTSSRMASMRMSKNHGRILLMSPCHACCEGRICARRRRGFVTNGGFIVDQGTFVLVCHSFELAVFADRAMSSVVVT